MFCKRNCVPLALLVKDSYRPWGPPQSPIQWIPRALSLGVKRPEREAGHSPPSSAVFKNAWSYTSTPLIRLHGVMLGLRKAQGHLYPLPIDNM